METCREEVKKVDLFVDSVLAHLDLDSTLFLLTSDHGNIEDLGTPGHTSNPVPTILWGKGKEAVGSRISSIADLTPAIIGILDQDARREISPVNQRIFIHLPYAELMGRLDTLAREKLYPEIYLPAHVLEETPPSALEQLALALQKNQLLCTIHGPFLDLNAGSRDESIRKVTLARYGQAFAAARLLKPQQMVLHPGYDRWHYGTRRMRRSGSRRA